jgi:hypothetical protein
MWTDWKTIDCLGKYIDRREGEMLKDLEIDGTISFESQNTSWMPNRSPLRWIEPELKCRHLPCEKLLFSSDLVSSICGSLGHLCLFIWSFYDNAGFRVNCVCGMWINNESQLAVFWVVTPCSLIWVCQRFGSLYCLHHQGDECSSETLVKLYQTTPRYNPEDSHLLTRHRENLRFYKIMNRLGYVISR